MLNRRSGKWIVGLKPADLDRGNVHVWFAVLDLPDAPLQKWIECISDEERGKAARFRFARDRKRFIAARAVLRSILGMCLDENPRRVSFRYGPHGKPELAEAYETSRVRFNVSHSHGCALYAV